MCYSRILLRIDQQTHSVDEAHRQSWFPRYALGSAIGAKKGRIMTTPSTSKGGNTTPDNQRVVTVPPMLVLHARISENTPRDLSGVETLARVAAETLQVIPQVIRGRQGPFSRTAWADDLAASREVLTAAGTTLTELLAQAPLPPLTVATDCALALATLPVIARWSSTTRVLWLDAHCDYDTPETTRNGFLGCMSLAGACGEWASGFAPPFPSRRVVLCGTRPAPGDFDSIAQQRVEASAVTLVGVSETTSDEVLAALEDAPVYLHLDPDVLDPSVNPVPYARPGGLSAEALQALLKAVAAHNPIVGVEITAFHAPDDPTAQDALGRLLIEAVAPLLVLAASRASG